MRPGRLLNALIGCRRGLNRHNPQFYRSGIRTVPWGFNEGKGELFNSVVSLCNCAG